MKISKSKSNNKTPQNPFNFDSIKNSSWLHVLNGIWKLLPEFKKTLSSSFWKNSLYFTSHVKIVQE